MRVATYVHILSVTGCVSLRDLWCVVTRATDNYPNSVMAIIPCGDAPGYLRLSEVSRCGNRSSDFLARVGKRGKIMCNNRTALRNVHAQNVLGGLRSL